MYAVLKLKARKGKIANDLSYCAILVFRMQLETDKHHSWKVNSINTQVIL